MSNKAKLALFLFSTLMLWLSNFFGGWGQEIFASLALIGYITMILTAWTR